MIVRFFSFVLFAVLLILTSCGSTERKKEAEQQQKPGGGTQRPPVRSEAITVSTTTLLDNIEIPGTIVANEETEIHPEVAGRITGIYFKEGSFVGRGAL